MRRTRKGRAAAKPIFDEAARQPETAKAPKTGKEKYPDKKSKEDEQKAAPELRKAWRSAIDNRLHNGDASMSELRRTHLKQ